MALIGTHRVRKTKITCQKVFMKRYDNLYKSITSFENLAQAHTSARKGKLYYREVKFVDKHLLKCLFTIQTDLINHTFKTSEYRHFSIIDKNKQRQISVLEYYPDRIAHWALMQVIEPILLRTFTYTTYAAIPKRGTHAALYKLHKYMKDKKGTTYCLKLDVKKFFQNINKDILKGLFRRKIKCESTLWLLDEIIDSFEPNSRIGIPIGNYTSQYFGNFYLSYFDHWLKDKKQVKYYLRYMDDMVILNESKEYLHSLFSDIQKYLKENLELDIKENWQIFPVAIRGVDFVGYRSFYDFTLLRQKTKQRLKRRVKAIIKSKAQTKELNENDLGVIASYNGVLGHCDSFRLRKNTLGKLLNTGA